MATIKGVGSKKDVPLLIRIARKPNHGNPQEGYMVDAQIDQSLMKPESVLDGTNKVPAQFNPHLVTTKVYQKDADGNDTIHYDFRNSVSYTAGQVEAMRKVAGAKSMTFKNYKPLNIREAEERTGKTYKGFDCDFIALRADIVNAYDNNGKIIGFAVNTKDGHMNKSKATTAVLDEARVLNQDAVTKAALTVHKAEKEKGAPEDGMEQPSTTPTNGPTNSPKAARAGRKSTVRSAPKKTAMADEPSL